MAVIDILCRVCGLMILALILLPGITFAGDEDTKPAYMIYIDPETGKYTTEDPEARSAEHSVVGTQPSSDVVERESLPRLVGVLALTILVIGGLLGLQRKQQMRQL